MSFTVKGLCDRCGKEGLLQSAFGKHICKGCISHSPNKLKGNAGLFGTGQMRFVEGSGLRLVKVPKSDGLFGKLFFEHYPGSKGIPGRSLCYLVYNNDTVIGIIGANSPPYNYKIFRAYFNTNDDNMFVNNNVFRLLYHEKNIGTKVLKLFRRQVYSDYKTKFNVSLLGICTFVEPPRTGAVYKADNWDYLGITEGKRMRRDKETWEKVFTEGTKKLIFGMRYDRKP